MLQKLFNAATWEPGVVRAGAVIFAWALVQGVVLWGPPGALALAVILVFLYTGLFITAHDAMHGAVAPGRPRLNRVLGALCARLHASFDFEQLRVAHLRHHADPAGGGDPDHHDGDARFLPWFLRFMGGYLTVGQLLRMALAFWLLCLVAPPHRVALGWALPAILSALQLFTFGIWRVHREPPGGWGDDPFRARSERFPRWLSWLTCWHFGHHREHHRYPHLPWWRLPEAPRVG